MDATLRTLTASPGVFVGGRKIHLAPLNLSLLVRLRYAQHPMPRTELGKLFWPNAEFRSNLSTALKTLRGALGDVYIPQHIDPVALGQALAADTDLVEAAADHPTRETVSAALEAYTAPFLVGIDSKLPTKTLVEWVTDQRRHYRTLLVKAVEAVCRGAAATGAWEEVEALATMARARGVSSEAVDELRREALQQKWVDTPPASPAESGTSASSPAETSVAASTPAETGAPKSPPAPRLRRSQWAVAAGLAITMLAASGVWALLPTKGAAAPRPCRTGEAVGHVVRKEFKPEINNPLAPGRTYSPLWVLRNAGRCTWDSAYAMRRVATIGPHPLNIETSMLPLGRVLGPGDTISVMHKVTAPSTPADYGEDWVLQDGEGRPVVVDGRPLLRERFQVLPHPVPPCAESNVRAGYLAASHPDSTVLWPQEAFTATWTVINRGKCVWQPGQVSVRYAGATGTRLSHPEIVELRTDEPIRPADAYTFEVLMRAPAAGRAEERWEVRTANRALGEMLEVRGTIRDRREPGGRLGGHRACSAGEELVGWLRSERIQDSTVVTAGDTVRKTWTLRNDGECTWAARSLALRFLYATASRESGVTSVPLDRPVPPQASYTFSIPLIAPRDQRLYEERWEIVNGRGTRLRIGQSLNLFAVIKVRRPSNAAN